MQRAPIALDRERHGSWVVSSGGAARSSFRPILPAGNDRTSHDPIVARRVDPRHPAVDRFVTLRLISAIQKSGKLFPCHDGRIRTSPLRDNCSSQRRPPPLGPVNWVVMVEYVKRILTAGPERMTGNNLSSAPCVYVVEPHGAGRSGRIRRHGRCSRQKEGGPNCSSLGCRIGMKPRPVGQCTAAAGQFTSTRGT
jgi:hypothetical protein